MNFILVPFKKLRNDFRRQIRWRRLSERDRNILVAESEMIRLHARWQSLLAAKKADEISRAECRVMVQKEYIRLNFNTTLGGNE
jgi:hypothetical protein